MLSKIWTRYTMPAGSPLEKRRVTLFEASCSAISRVSSHTSPVGRSPRMGLAVARYRWCLVVSPLTGAVGLASSGWYRPHGRQRAPLLPT